MKKSKIPGLTGKPETEPEPILIPDDSDFPGLKQYPRSEPEPKPDEWISEPSTASLVPTDRTLAPAPGANTGEGAPVGAQIYANEWPPPFPEAPLELERDHPDQGTKPSMPEAKPKRKYTKRTGKATEQTPAQARADRDLLAHAFDGTFQVLGMALGPHWALNEAREIDGRKYPAEGELLADAWQPVFDRYGGKITGEALMWISASTATVAVVAPRIRQSAKQDTGVIGWFKRRWSARRAKRAK